MSVNNKYCKYHHIVLSSFGETDHLTPSLQVKLERSAIWATILQSVKVLSIKNITGTLCDPNVIVIQIPARSLSSDHRKSNLNNFFYFRRKGSDSSQQTSTLQLPARKVNNAASKVNRTTSLKLKFLGSANELGMEPPPPPSGAIAYTTQQSHSNKVTFENLKQNIVDGKTKKRLASSEIFVLIC